MLKKTALSLFGLAVMLICFNPPQAACWRGGFVGHGLSASGLCSSVPVCCAAALRRLPAGSLLLCADLSFVRGLGISSGLPRVPAFCSAQISSIASSWAPSLLATVIVLMT